MDLAESALKRAVLAGEGWAVCFALKCQGKNRGYVERVETNNYHHAVVDLQQRTVRRPSARSDRACHRRKLGQANKSRVTGNGDR